ncbi:MAG: hypothetical protein IPL23_05900 [Saprospiraceae bacterium]|nr:hypothetical protein [Saprospiraceae bacterium]
MRLTGDEELIAYGSILKDGKNVRMSGQDVKRGTFSHRHAVYTDEKTYEQYNRLNGAGNGRFMIFNSLLSEFAVLGFEYGYSLSTPDSLVLWEAQFGDFSNGAQTIIDQFISAADGRSGPEHSSARLERYLQLCANFNMIIANVTSPSNYFHLLRRQLAMPYRKPLIVMSPKSMLRHPKCMSPISELESGNEFLPIIAEKQVKPKDAKRLLFCSGKVYYELDEYRTANKITDTAIYRVEQLYPLDEEQIRAIIKEHGKAEVFWVQEESSNYGPWLYLMQYFRKDNIELVARKPSASPATGFKKVHDQQQEDLMKRAFGVA